MLQICFIECQNFDKKSSVALEVLMIYQKHFVSWYQKTNSKFPKDWKIGKYFSKSCFFISFPPDSLQFQKQLMTKSETHFAFKPLWSH